MISEEKREELRQKRIKRKSEKVLKKTETKSEFLKRYTLFVDSVTHSMFK